MPGPASVIESSLLVGFVGRKEQTGHKSQKPVPVYEQIIRMRRRKVIFCSARCAVRAPEAKCAANMAAAPYSTT